MTGPAGVGIHQVLVAASPGDAITNLALGIRGLLRRACPSEIYARHIAPGLLGEVLPLMTYQPHHPSRSVLIFHASIGQSDAHEFLTSRPEPLVLVYHNVTPTRYFEPYDPAFADLLALGRREVERLVPRVVCAIADSRYNARELEEMGCSDVRVVPPIVDLRRLSRVEPAAGRRPDRSPPGAPSPPGRQPSSPRPGQRRAGAGGGGACPRRRTRGRGPGSPGYR